MGRQQQLGGMELQQNEDEALASEPNQMSNLAWSSVRTRPLAGIRWAVLSQKMEPY
jgi:hypothetical protein